MWYMFTMLILEIYWDHFRIFVILHLRYNVVYSAKYLCPASFWQVRTSLLTFDFVSFINAFFTAREAPVQTTLSGRWLDVSTHRIPPCLK